jgi:hypothetical protein
MADAEHFAKLGVLGRFELSQPLEREERRSGSGGMIRR